MELSDLKKIGLTRGEIQIYSALLDLGETTRTELAKRSGISPSKIYDVANRLLEKGIISSVKKGGVIHFSAGSPERLKEFLLQKQEELEREKGLVDSMLPQLLAKYQQKVELTDVEVFYGWEGMKSVYNDLVSALEENEINYILGASSGKDSKRADLFFGQHYVKVEKKGFKVKIIFNENIRGNTKRTGYYSRSKKHEIKFLYHDTFTEINVYRGVVLFVMLLEKPIVIRVKNNEAADSFKQFFNSLWKSAKK